MNTFYQNRHIVVTGGFGFIGSNLVRLLNSKGIAPFVIEKIDSIGEKWRNVRGLSFHLVDDIPEPGLPSTVVHLGADVDTTAPMTRELWDNNVNYTLKLLAKRHDYCGPLPRFIYASSGATYGNEERDFTERLNIKPENAYSFTKLSLDRLFEGKHNVYGLRFFNVWGQNEGHKGNMKSIVSRAMDIKNGVFEIFKTGRADIPDGEQARDCIHVEDVCSVIWHFIQTESDAGGVFNVGTGRATTFNEIADALGLKKKYVEMPESVKRQYQFYTKADITKLRAAGYTAPFLTLEEGIEKTREWMKREGQIAG